MLLMMSTTKQSWKKEHNEWTSNALDQAESFTATMGSIRKADDTARLQSSFKM